MTADTIVLGAGIIGVSTAIHLARRGRSVVLVDRRTAGEETSFGNAGLIQREVPTIHSATMGAGLEAWDIMRHVADSEVHRFYRAAPGGVPD
ncbi:Dihydroxy-acid dehydratase [compost metagenome]